MNFKKNRNLLEVFIKKKYYFPYEHIDSLKDDIHKICFEDYHLYLVLSTDKLIIENTFYSIIKNTQQIIIKNPITNEIADISLNLRKYTDIDIPLHLLQFNLINNSSVLQIKFNTESLQLVKSYNFHKYYAYSALDLNLRIHISQLLDENNMSQMLQDFNLLYVGKSINLKKRLLNHETILRIQRDMIRKYTNKSLYIVIIQLNSKLLSKTSITPFSQFFTTNSRWLETNFAPEVDYITLVNITEATLINHFKPKYNTLFVENKPSFSKKTFKTIFKYDIQSIDFTLDMYFDNSYFILNTKQYKTNTGMTIIHCKIDSRNNIRINAESISEEFYQVL